ncbi:arsenate reductase family protein [Shimazuella sp. AN120528]|uniref:arsenate reductase family protein n=1 Tax=Shimazuella soli TaxID=1892854 RepID=UPI001F10EA02|nr:arsenate reductase family protein [Shimazuella soli]MCH5583369.1 arsenate reductase family protein [Shimazuella soli]
MLTFFQYPKCGTCRKAKKFLNDQGISYEERHIVEKPPTVEELREFITISDLPIQKFFNTSGQVYRKLDLSKRLPNMTDEEKLELLASDGMLVKRPILTDGKSVTVGFKEEEWKEKWT